MQRKQQDIPRSPIDRSVLPSGIRGVYLVTDHGDRLPERVRDAISGGIALLQYRNKTLDAHRKLKLGLELKDICADEGIPFIVNDDLELARKLDADGLHLGQEDGSPVEARRILGPDKIIGVSTHNLEEALRAEADGADYVGFGAMYPTGSKDISHLAGPEALADMKPRLNIPVVAIGGINRGNASKVIDSGADAMAVISAVLESDDPAVAAAELSLLFNRRDALPRGVVLTVAGSDSGGGAGIQADLKTIALLGSYGASVITAVTAQNTMGVSGIHGIPPPFVAKQLEAVLSDLPVDVVKTGMLCSAKTIGVVADKLAEYRKKIVVVDPVMIAKGGTSLLDPEALALLKGRLLPLTYLLTPNIPEAEKLTGISISDENGMRDAARALCSMGVRNVLVKGGHLPEGMAVDILFDGSAFTRYQTPRLSTRNTHGTGCTLASAIATFLAQGEPLHQAVASAKEFITSAIKLAKPMGKGQGPVNHFLAARKTGTRD
ncbi:MAG: bifunctional hydroxymethylpyrimidine kinase/phosphomethylpyrimidine kinase [Geobacteraceae bacterium]